MNTVLLWNYIMLKLNVFYHFINYTSKITKIISYVQYVLICRHVIAAILNMVDSSPNRGLFNIYIYVYIYIRWSWNRFIFLLEIFISGITVFIWKRVRVHLQTSDLVVMFVTNNSVLGKEHRATWDRSMFVCMGRVGPWTGFPTEYKDSIHWCLCREPDQWWVCVLMVTLMADDAMAPTVVMPPSRMAYVLTTVKSLI